jgi:peptidoglycan glycosyltransferase
VNVATARLHVFLMGLLTLLVAFTSYWSVVDAEDLEENSANRRPLIEEQRIPRGDIVSRDGALIAKSRKGDGGLFERTYPEGSLFGHPIGYDFIERGRTGVERSLNDTLTGETNEFASIIDELEGQTRRGNDVTVTLDAEAQRTATAGLGSQAGAVVAIEPATGAVRAMVSSPGFDPNQVPGQFAQLNADEQGTPLFNRATQAGLEPGSTMKVVTAAAALDSGEYTPDTTVDGSSPAEISGAPLQNFGGSSFGQISLTAALTNSVNTAWARVAEDLGADTILDYMDRFGFGEDPPLDYPDDQMLPSGVYEGGRTITDGDQIDIGRVAIGQERLLVTPLQMALVAATVANGGVQMRPTLLQSATDKDGREVEELSPREVRRVISPESAANLTEMMANVVREGTGTAAALSGIDVAGKTGTAEVDVTAGINRAWFIGFAPVGDPQVAVAAVIERTSGTGGEVAGPIARDVMQSLIG